MSTRTPGPWKISSGFLVAPSFPGTEGTPHFPMYELDRVVGDKVDDEADRAFIVQACNAHDDLLTQLKGLLGLAQFIISATDIDADLTTCVLRNKGEAVAEVPIALLLSNAQAAIANAEGTP